MSFSSLSPCLLVLGTRSNLTKKIMSERNSITFEQLPTAAKKSIEDIIKKERFTTHTKNCFTFSTQGGNYMSALYEIDIKGTTDKGEKVINLFVKTAIPIGEYLSEVTTSNESYLREGYVYKELFKVFEKLQEEAHVPVEERYRTLKGYDESTADVLILENLSKKGYKLCERRQVVPLKFAELAIQQLAKLHGLGFALEKYMPECFKEFVEIHSHRLKITEKFETFMKNLAKSTMINLTGDYKKKAERFIPKCVKRFSKYMTIDETTISTVCHVDYRADNILAKITNGEATDVISVDYQSLAMGCPANDFMYFIYTGTDRQFRKQHMHNLIELYYDSLKNFLKYFNMDVSKVYPREVFDKALEDRRDYGLTIALPFFLLMFAPEDNVPNLDSDVDELNIVLDKNIVKRLEELIDETVEAGLL